MNLKMTIACGMLLGLLSAVSFAQHGRLATGGTVPGARLPSATSGLAPINSRSVGTFPGQTRPSPSAEKVGVTPNAATNPATRTVGPNTPTVPDHMTVPDTVDLGNRTRIGPNQ